MTIPKVSQEARELLPCPFCGAEATAYEAFPQFDFPWDMQIEHHQDCPLAPLDRVCYETHAALVSAWNTRGESLIRSKMSEGWQPIATAPKDGTEILLGAPAQTYAGKPTEPRSTIGHWTTEEECMEKIGDCGGECRCPEYKFHDPYWMTWDGGFTEENPPTHWRPLPAPPSIRQLGERGR